MEFVDNSTMAKRVIEKQAIKALLKICQLVEGQAVLLAPVNMGGLRDSIGYKVNESELKAYIGTNCEYAIWVEFGTGEFAEKGNGRKGGWVYQDPSGDWFFTWGMEPQPYLRPAFRRNKKQIQAIITECLRLIGG